MITLIYFINVILRQLDSGIKFTQSVRKKQSKHDAQNLNNLFRPVPVKKNVDDANIGVELTGSISKHKMIQILCDFAKHATVKELSAKYGLDGNFFILVSFILKC